MTITDQGAKGRTLIATCGNAVYMLAASVTFTIRLDSRKMP